MSTFSSVRTVFKAIGKGHKVVADYSAGYKVLAYLRILGHVIGSDMRLLLPINNVLFFHIYGEPF